MVDDDALEIIRMRNNFYRDNYRRMILVLLLSMLLNIGFGFGLYYVISHPTQPQYFATTNAGAIIPLTPLSEPNLSKQALLQWVLTAATSAYTYDFVNYRKALQDASQYFTPEGWQQFMKALDATNNLDAVQAKKLVVSAVPTDAPVILQEGLIQGSYAWKIQFPLLVKYQSASTQVQQSLLITILVTRVPTLNTPRGIGIAQFIASGN